MGETKKLRVGTVFSGIGAPEFALKRLGIPHEIVFACDNGEIDMLESEDDIAKQLEKINSLEAVSYTHLRAHET